MAVAVVDLLEAVEVEQGQAVLAPPVAVANGQRRGGPVEQRLPRQYAGEGVALEERAQPSIVLEAFSDGGKEHVRRERLDERRAAARPGRPQRRSIFALRGHVNHRNRLESVILPQKLSQ